MPKKTSLLDDLIALPWWFSLFLAGVVYFGFKYYLPTIMFESPVFQGISKAFPTMAGMFAFIFVLAAVISAYHAWRKGELLDRQTSVKSIKAVNWKDFEYLVSEAYRRQGYSVQENTGGGADGGIDLVLKKDGNHLLVQCKNWRSRKVGVTTVREFFGVVTAENATEGMVVCSGHFTNDAIEFAQGKPITLVDGAALSRLIGNVQRSPQIKAAVKDALCPICRNPMVMRTAKRGNNVGSRFWGCSKFPACRGTRNMTD
jgi:restriction system protein